MAGCVTYEPPVGVVWGCSSAHGKKSSANKGQRSLTMVNGAGGTRHEFELEDEFVADLGESLF